MSEENKELFKLEEDTEQDDLNLNSNHHESNDDQRKTSQDNQWINELRVALERGCDLGSIRNIGKCRPLTDDLRLRVWKVRKLITKPSD
jgi:hypothetical protein